MKILLSQINPFIGDIEGNSKKILDNINNAKKLGADLIIFPEMSLIGYPPLDLLEKKWLIDKNIKFANEIVSQTKGIGVIFGYVDKNPGKAGKKLFNAAIFAHNGKIIRKYYKQLLPTYDVFDERRYFEPGNKSCIFKFKGQTIALTICEDVWNDKDFWKERIYEKDPLEEMAQFNPDFIINISASPFTIDKTKIKEEMFKTIVKKYKIPFISVNQVGGNDSLIFDGRSIAFDKNARIIARASDFKEDNVLVDIEKGKGDIHPISKSKIESVYNALLLGIRDYVTKCGFKKVVVGLSGGIDSSLTAVLAVNSLGSENVLGVSMPSEYTSQSSIDDARQLAQNLKIKFEIIPITPTFHTLKKELQNLFKGLKENITEENLQARIRSNILMAISNKLGYLVLSTGNKSELATGYCTLYGDMSGGLAVISDVPKTMVYELANYINNVTRALARKNLRQGCRVTSRKIIPINVIKKAPTAELKPNQKDSDTLPEYEILDPILKAYIEDQKGIDEIIKMGFDKALVKKVINMVDKSEYKRQQSAPTLKVTSKAFGFGRRMPIAYKINY